MTNSDLGTAYPSQQQGHPEQKDRAGEFNDCTIIRFSSDDVPPGDRLGGWNRHRHYMPLKTEIEPAAGHAFTSRFISTIVPRLRVLSGYISPVRVTRTPDPVADGNDDLTLFINRSGSMTVSSRGRTVSLREGDAVLLSGDDVMGYDRTSSGSSLSLRIPCASLAPLIAGVFDSVMRIVPREAESLRLLTSYVSLLIEENTLARPGLRRHVVSHVHELVGLTLGPAESDTENIRNGGVRAARLRAAKAYVWKNSCRPDISVGAVAQYLGITPRYLQRLFELEGTTFSSFLVGQRLAHAQRLLCEPRLAERPVSAIAYEVGFSDLSYFNRCFRRVYGATPRDIRASSRRSCLIQARNYDP